MQPDTEDINNNCGLEWPHAKGRSSCPAQKNVCKVCKIKCHYERMCRRRDSKKVSSIIISAIHLSMSMSISEVSKLPKLKVTVGQDEEIMETEVVTESGAQASRI